MSAPRVSVVVVSYQVRDLLRRCLQTLAAQRGVDLETWVVDNASSDGSADMVEREFPGVHLVRSHENLGFARGNNLALRQARGDLLALVNPDTEWPPDGLATIAQVFERHPAAGCVGLALDNPDGSPQPSCHAFAGVLNALVESLALHRALLRAGYATPTESPTPRGGEGHVDWVSGACFVMKRGAFEAVGGLDESLFMYGEEMNWCWRARAKGFTTVYSDRARVIHHGGASGAGQRGALYVRNLEARLDFIRRFRGPWRAAIAREIMTAGSLARLAYWSWRAGRKAPPPWTADQIERFRAVVRWRWGRAG